MDVARWIGIPYSLRGEPPESADCYSLCRAVSEQVFRRPIPAYFYSVASTAAQFVASATTNGWRLCADPLPGDILTFRVRGLAMHCGILIDGADFLHILAGRNSTLESLHDLLWTKRFAGAYRYTEHRLPPRW